VERAALPREDVLGIVSLQTGEALSSKARREARRLRRKLEQDRAGRVRMSEGPEEAARDMDALLALHTARWGDEGFDRAGTEFQRRFARSAAERGWLRLWVAEADGVMAGALCNWCVGTSTFSYIQSFDPEYARYGIGTILHEDATALAREEGCSEYNILRGEEGFKQKFPAQPRALESYVVVRARSAAGSPPVACWACRRRGGACPRRRARRPSACCGAASRREATATGPARGPGRRAAGRPRTREVARHARRIRAAPRGHPHRVLGDLEALVAAHGQHPLAPPAVDAGGQQALVHPQALEPVGAGGPAAGC
jgi:GNAT superfamily N-acetyltransferase